MGKCDERSIRALENRLAEGATCEQLEAAVAGADDWIRRRVKVPFAVVFGSTASLERFAHEGRKILDAKAFKVRRAAEERRKDREWRVQQRTARHSEAVPTAEKLRKLIPTPPPLPQPSRPKTAEELAQHRAEQLARFEAWGKENGLAEGT